jgi:hypothetical protein
MIKRTNYLLAIGIDKYKSGEWENLDNAVSNTKALEVLTTKYSFELIQSPLYNEDARLDPVFPNTNTVTSISIPPMIFITLPHSFTIINSELSIISRRSLTRISSDKINQ